MGRNWYPLVGRGERVRCTRTPILYLDRLVSTPFVSRGFNSVTRGPDKTLLTPFRNRNPSPKIRLPLPVSTTTVGKRKTLLCGPLLRLGFFVLNLPLCVRSVCDKLSDRTSQCVRLVKT